MIITGYPVPETAAQSMWEADAAAEWERQNARPNEAKLINAAKRMRQGAMKIGDAADHLVAAIKILGDIPEADKVSSLLISLEDLWDEVNNLQRRYAKGVSE